MNLEDESTVFNTKLYVVIDTDGTCLGVFIRESTANSLAKFHGAYVSEQWVKSE